MCSGRGRCCDPSVFCKAYSSVLELNICYLRCFWTVLFTAVPGQQPGGLFCNPLPNSHQSLLSPALPAARHFNEWRSAQLIRTESVHRCRWPYSESDWPFNPIESGRVFPRTQSYLANDPGLWGCFSFFFVGFPFEAQALFM